MINKIFGISSQNTREMLSAMKMKSITHNLVLAILPRMNDKLIKTNKS